MATFSTETPAFGRQRAAGGGERRGGERDAHHGKAENELAVGLAGDELRAFRGDVADIAHDREIGSHRAGERRHIVGFPGDEAADKGACLARDHAGFRELQREPRLGFRRNGKACEACNIGIHGGVVGFALLEQLVDARAPSPPHSCRV